MAIDFVIDVINVMIFIEMFWIYIVMVTMVLKMKLFSFMNRCNYTTSNIYKYKIDISIRGLLYEYHWQHAK